MQRTLGIIEANPLAPWWRRYAERCIAGKTLLEWVVRRVTDCTRLSHVVVVLGRGEDWEQLARLTPPDVEVFHSHARDALARACEALDAYRPAAVVRLQAENPFVDPALIDRLVSTGEQHAECDYITYSSRSGRSAVMSSLGLVAEWCRAEALQTANRLATSPAERAQMTRFLYSHPERFQVRLVPLPAEMDREDLRLKLDHVEDWEHALEIYEALGPEQLDWQRIAELLQHQPELRQRMAVLNRDHAA
ncbi:MAG: NTP transferase domain-containing protein [Pirellulales bacterium]|nr:NTP transferase domain-containing protein [Pirellulales bacterium]